MRTARHQPDYILLITVLMLTGIGIVTVYSASTVVDLHKGMAADHMAVRQLACAIFGLVIFGVSTYIPYQAWYKHAAKLLALATFLLIAVLVPGLGHRSNGASRWLGTTSLHLQPSAVAVIVAVIYLSFFLTKKMPVLHDWRRAFRPAMLVILILCGLVMIEPDMGTTMALFGTALVLLFASGLKLRPLLLTLVVMLPSAYLLAHVASYRSNRLASFMHPFTDTNNGGYGGYQLIQGLTAIARGGLTGQGFDLSIMATGFLPEAHTDFIFAVFTEQWGWIGDAGLLAIFVILIWRGFHIARFARDRFGSLLAIGLTSTIIIQAAINLGAVTWLIPVTGIPLPFISYGGTAIVINLFAMGILMSVSREVGDEVTDIDVLADIVSVEDFRSVRTQAPAKHANASIPRTQRQRQANVTSLSTRRGSSTWDATSRRKTQESDRQTRRNISLTWKSQQEKTNAANDSQSNRRKNGRNKR